MVGMTVPFTEAHLRTIAPSRSFERGFDYVDSISDIDVTRDRATATVYGSGAYLVLLTWGDGALDGTCTCPHGEEGYFCKHCVALGFKILSMGDDLTRLISDSEAKQGAMEAWLRSLSHEDLVGELLDVIGENPELRRRYELRAASFTGEVGAVRRSIYDLLYFDYDTHDYSARISGAATAIQGILDAGKAEDAIELAREALDLLADNIEEVDQADYWLGGDVPDLLGVHLRACKAAPPDTEDLAYYLVELLLRDYGAELAIGEYDDLLGEEGRRLIRDEIARTFAEEPGNWIARNRMEALARADGDIDSIVALYAANPDALGMSHMRIVRELDGAGRDAEALTWAERGLRECASPGNELVDYLADRYANAGRSGDVLELRRARFAAQQTLADYQALRRAAQAHGDWQAERESALARLRASRPGGFDGPVLVDVLTDDGDLDAAWTAADGVATEAQMIRLADASVGVRPADALAVYLRAIAPLYQLLGDDVYRRMARLLLSMRACHEALGTSDEFQAFVSAIRTDLKRKRNLMRILDESGLLPAGRPASCPARSRSMPTASSWALV